MQVKAFLLLINVPYPLLSFCSQLRIRAFLRKRSVERYSFSHNSNWTSKSHSIVWAVLIINYSSFTVHNGAAEILGGFWSQTPPLSLTQYVTAYQFLGPCDIVLPRHESFQVGHLKANIDIKSPTLKLLGRGKTMP